MNKLIRLYNENRFIIVVFVIIIALIILVIQVLNGIVKENDDKNKININQMSKNETISPSNVSKMTGEEVQNNEFYTNTIKKFVDYCNIRRSRKSI